MRTRTFQQPNPATLEALAPGTTDLGACLDVLGAPLLVREEQDGAVLAWGWEENQDWAATLTVPVDQQSLRFTYNEIDVRLRGVVGFFDGDWRLTELRKGQLSELLPEQRARPRVVE